MANRQLKLYSRQPNGETWADPIQPNYTIRFKTTTTPKSLDGNRTTNYMTEIIMNDVHNVTIGDQVTADALSVRIRTSGAIESIDQLKNMLKDSCEQLVAAWLEEDVLTGFPVDTPPYRTE